MNKDSFYGLFFGFIISDSVSNNYNNHLSNRGDFKDFNKIIFKNSYHSSYLFKVLKILIKNNIDINIDINKIYELLLNKLYKWFKKTDCIKINPILIRSLNNYNNNNILFIENNIYNDYFGLILLPIFKTLNLNLYKITHSLPIYYLLTNTLLDYINNLKHKYIPEIFENVINEPFTTSTDAFEVVRCSIKAFIETDNYLDGLMLILKSIETNPQPISIIYGIIAGNYYGITNISENFNLKQINNLKNYLNVIDDIWKYYIKD